MTIDKSSDQTSPGLTVTFSRRELVEILLTPEKHGESGPIQHPLTHTGKLERKILNFRTVTQKDIGPSMPELLKEASLSRGLTRLRAEFDLSTET